MYSPVREGVPKEEKKRSRLKISMAGGIEVTDNTRDAGSHRGEKQRFVRREGESEIEDCVVP